MATRLYYSTSVWPPIDPGFSSLWDQVGTSTSNSLVKAPESETNFWGDLETADPAEHALPAKIGAWAAMSPALIAQTISGTVKGQMFADEWTAGSGFCRSVVIRVLSADGLTERGVLLAYFPGTLTSEFPEAYDDNGDGHPTYQNRCMPPEVALTPVECQEGDVIQVEIGFTRFAVGNPTIDENSAIGEIWAYSQGNGDLPENETTLIAYDPEDFNPAHTPQPDPWIEFSQDLEFFISGIVTNEITAFKFGGGGEFQGIVPKSFSQVGSGGFGFAGEGDFNQAFPSRVELMGSGGFIFGGSGILLKSKVFTLTGNVSFLLGGKGDFNGVQTTRTDQIIVGSGGMVLGGTGTFFSQKPRINLFVGSVGFKLGAIQIPPSMTTRPGSPRASSFGTAIGFVLGGEGIWETSHPVSSVTVSPGAMFGISGGGTFVLTKPSITLIVGTGGFIFCGGLDVQAIFDTWALSGQAYEPSFFSGFNFNSYAAFRGNFYGAGPDGIYLLEGPDDNGEPIHTGMRIGPVNFGSDQEKRLRGIQFGDAGRNTKVKVTADNQSRVFEPYRDDNRVVVSRDLIGREFTLDFSDFKKLSQLEITVLKLARR